MVMLQERGVTNFVPIGDRLGTASVSEVASALNNALKVQLGNPDQKPYAAYKLMVSSNLPLRISDNLRQKALEAMVSEDEVARIAGKDAFLWLSMRKIIAAVDSVFIEGKDSEEDREEMFDSAVLSVMTGAPGLKDKEQISARINELARAGIRSYFVNKYDIKLDHISDPVRDIALIRSVEGIIEDSEGDGQRAISDGSMGSAQEACEREALVSVMKNALEKVLGGGYEGMRQQEILKLQYGIEDGTEWSDTKIAGKIIYSSTYVAAKGEEAIRELRHPSRRDLFEGYI